MAQSQPVHSAKASNTRGPASRHFAEASSGCSTSHTTAGMRILHFGRLCNRSTRIGDFFLVVNGLRIFLACYMRRSKPLSNADSTARIVRLQKGVDLSQFARATPFRPTKRIESRTPWTLTV